MPYVGFDGKPDYPERGRDAPPPEPWRGLAVFWVILAAAAFCGIVAWSVTMLR